MSKLTGTIYLTLRRRTNYAVGWPFTVVKASSSSGEPPGGAVEIPIKLSIDEEWFRMRPALVEIDVANPPPVEGEAGEPRT